MLGENLIHVSKGGSWPYCSINALICYRQYRVNVVVITNSLLVSIHISGNLASVLYMKFLSLKMMHLFYYLKLSMWCLMPMCFRWRPQTYIYIHLNIIFIKKRLGHELQSLVNNIAISFITSWSVYILLIGHFFDHDISIYITHNIPLNEL